MIEITKSPNADSRTSKDELTVDELRKSTESHIKDVSKGLGFIAELIQSRCPFHDHTKIDMMDEFYAALTSGKIKETNWYQKHITEERHHLKSYVHNDITLVDVIEHVVDCTMAGLARSGDVYDIDLSPDVLVLAVNNTVELLKKNTRVVTEEVDVLDQEIDS